MLNNSEYLDLITSEYATQPKYMAYVEAFLEMLSPIVQCYESFADIFYLFKELSNPTSTVDDQLDKIGEIFGVSRYLPSTNENIPPILDNETYQKVLRSRVYINSWDGTIQGLANIIETIYPNLDYEIVDGQDMSYTVLINSQSETALTLALLTEGFILPKPAGVKVNYIIVDDPLFGWNLDTSVVKGWDLAKWNRF